ncbi:MAG: hypothetical protein ACYDCC_16400, partial [Actinomycetota bacterium]
SSRGFFFDSSPDRNAGMTMTHDHSTIMQGPSVDSGLTCDSEYQLSLTTSQREARSLLLAFPELT